MTFSRALPAGGVEHHVCITFLMMDFCSRTAALAARFLILRFPPDPRAVGANIGRSEPDLFGDSQTGFLEGDPDAHRIVAAPLFTLTLATEDIAKDIIVEDVINE
jgi:hypothetical protein